MDLPEARLTDREFLILLKEDLDHTHPPEILDRLQLVIDRLAPERIIAAVRAYEDHILRDLDEDDV